MTDYFGAATLLMFVQISHRLNAIDSRISGFTIHKKVRDRSKSNDCKKTKMTSNLICCFKAYKVISEFPADTRSHCG